MRTPRSQMRSLSSSSSLSAYQGDSAATCIDYILPWEWYQVSERDRQRWWHDCRIACSRKALMVRIVWDRRSTASICDGRYSPPSSRNLSISRRIFHCAAEQSSCGADHWSAADALVGLCGLTREIPDRRRKPAGGPAADQGVRPTRIIVSIQGEL